MLRNDTYLIQMKIEARRDYLLSHAERINNLLQSYNNVPKLEDYVFKRARISHWSYFVATQDNNDILEQYLYLVKEKAKPIADTAIQDAIESLDIVLLPNTCDESSGISRNLSDYFHQLKLQERPSFIELSEEAGLQHYWDNENAQRRFAELLNYCGIEATHSIGNAPQHKDYSQSSYIVTVPHADIDKELKLAQYHPYTLHDAVNDLYNGKKIDRAVCLVNSVTKKNKDISIETAVIGDTARVSLNEKNDIVSLGVTALFLDDKKKKYAQHIVILLDDSGSMQGTKMQTANSALERFVLQLPDDTLVSLQPFNESTRLTRVPASAIKEMSSDQKKLLFNISATGGTPLVEMLACSAGFMRRDKKSLIIKEEELNHTTVVMLTDGQANGILAVNALQTLKNSTDYKKPRNVLLDNAEISYGIPGFSFKGKPVIITAGIGADSDRKFIEDLSEELSCPHAYLNDQEKEEVFEKQLNDFLNLIKSVQGRLPSLFVALKYYNTSTKKIEIVGVEAQNLFLGFMREISFMVPKTAINIEACLIDGDAYRFFSVDNQVQNRPDLIESYVRSEFLKLRQNYRASIYPLQQQISQGQTSQKFLSFASLERFGSKFKIPDVPEQKNADQWSVKIVTQLDLEEIKKLDKCMLLVNHSDDERKKNIYFIEQGELIKIDDVVLTNHVDWPMAHAKLSDQVFQTAQYAGERKKIVNFLLCHLEGKKLAGNNGLLTSVYQQIKAINEQTRLQANSYIAQCPDTPLANQMQLFVNALSNSGKLAEKDISLVHDRFVVAQFTQTRFMGKPADLATVQIREDQIFIFIKNFDFRSTLELLQADLSLLNTQQKTSNYHATPFIYATVLLHDLPNNDPNKQLLREFIIDMCALSPPFNAVDAMGNTALHRLIWQGEFELAMHVIRSASLTDGLEKLLKIRNKAMVGATEGETCLDLIRSVPFTVLDSKQKKTLLSLVFQPVQTKNLFDLIAGENVEAIQLAIDDCPSDLNKHSGVTLGYTTPLFALLYQIKNNPLNKREEKEKLILWILEKHGNAIDFTEPNGDGNTLLHYVFFHGLIDFSEKMLDQAIKNKQLPAALIARNCLILTTGSGETALMNFVHLYTKCCNDFVQTCQSIQTDYGQDVDLSQLEKDRATDLVNKKSAYERFFILYHKIEPYLTPLQTAEINHLALIHHKGLEGYSSYSWLKAAPIPALDEVIQQCAYALYTQPAAEVDHVFNLKRYLERLRANDVSYERVQEFVDELLKKLDDNPSAKKIFQNAQYVLAQHAMFVKLTSVVSISSPTFVSSTVSTTSTTNRHVNIPKPTSYSFDKAKGIIIGYANPLDADVPYSQIPNDCKGFIKLHGDGTIQISPSSGEGSPGVYPAKTPPHIGINCINEQNKQIIAQALYFVGTNKVEHRDNALYIVDPSFFKSSSVVANPFTRSYNGGNNPTASSEREKDEYKDEQKCAIS